MTIKKALLIGLLIIALYVALYRGRWGHRLITRPGLVAVGGISYTLYLYQKAFRDFDMGYASAMAWVLLLIIALFTWLAFATQDRWVHYGEE